MNTIEEITTKVVYIEWDDENQCYHASIDKSVLCPVAYGMNIQYQRRASVFIELTTIDCSNIDVNSIITIKTIEHQPGEQIELYGYGYYTFENAGISNIITSIS